MYSENQRHSPSRRANDEFLRRMLGGELSYGNTDQKMRRDDSSMHGNRACGCQKKQNYCSKSRNDGVIGSSCPLARRSDPPACNDGDITSPSHHNHCLNAPSLAMVYSPKQGFQNIYEPFVALKQGTLFAELDLPFEGCGRKEACARRCDQ